MPIGSKDPSPIIEKRLRALDRVMNVTTSGTLIAAENADRIWISLVNGGPSELAIELLDFDGTVTGSVRLGSLGSVVFSRYGDLPWFGAIQGTAIGSNVTVHGVEVQEDRFRG